jgi:DNA-binding NarL/FixJ family response regulator
MLNSQTPGQPKFKKYRIVIISNSPGLRQGIGNLLDNSPVFTVLASASTFKSLLVLSKSLQPDAILWSQLDYNNFSHKILMLKNTCPLTAIIALIDSESERLGHLTDIIHTGIDGCLSLGMAPRYFLKTLEITIQQRCFCLSAHIMAQCLKDQQPSLTSSHNKKTGNIYIFNNQNQSSPKDMTLTAREKDILALLMHNNRQIANELKIGEATVKTHISRILSKLNVKTRSQAILAALKGSGHNNWEGNR